MIIITISYMYSTCHKKLHVGVLFDHIWKSLCEPVLNASQQKLHQKGKFVHVLHSCVHITPQYPPSFFYCYLPHYDFVPLLPLLYLLPVIMPYSNHWQCSPVGIVKSLNNAAHHLSDGTKTCTHTCAHKHTAHRHSLILFHGWVNGQWNLTSLRKLEV